MRKLLHSLRALLIVAILGVGILSTTNVYADEDVTRVIDNAGVLSDSQFDRISQELDRISNSMQVDVIVATDYEDIDSYNVQAIADNIFDEGDYGMGANKDGILLYINTNTRDWAVSTSGYGITAFTDYGIDYLMEQITPDLSNGDYANAFMGFASYSEDYIQQAKNGHPYTKDTLTKKTIPWGKNIIIAIVVGLIIGLIYTLSLKGQLTSVAPQNSAVNYVSANASNVRDGGSFYLYSTVARVPRQQSNNSNSSTHTSMSGATHGGRSGKF